MFSISFNYHNYSFPLQKRNILGLTVWSSQPRRPYNTMASTTTDESKPTGTAQVPLPQITIKFCVQCKWNLRAAYVSLSFSTYVSPFSTRWDCFGLLFLELQPRILHEHQESRIITWNPLRVPMNISPHLPNTHPSSRKNSYRHSAQPSAQ